MHANITVTISDTATGNEIPERKFTASAPLALELPQGADEFIESLETLVTRNLNPMLQRLVQRVQEDMQAYIEYVEKTGLKQPDLPGIVPEA